jgi:uncharacterized protein (DUF2267 family)
MSKSHDWIRDVAEESGLNQDAATQVLRAVLQSFRDDLTVEQNERLGPQMPVAIRELYFESWNPAHPEPAIRGAAPFLDRVRERAGDSIATQDPARLVRGTLLVLDRHMPALADKLKHLLSKEIRELWPSTIAEETLERHEELAAQERAAQKQALHAEDGHERGAPMAPHQNRTPGDEHRGGPLPNRM